MEVNYNEIPLEDLEHLKRNLLELLCSYRRRKAPDRCPMCRYDIAQKKKRGLPAYGECQFCPWIVLDGIKCHDFWQHSKPEPMIARFRRVRAWYESINWLIALRKADERSLHLPTDRRDNR